MHQSGFKWEWHSMIKMGERWVQNPSIGGGGTR